LRPTLPIYGATNTRLQLPIYNLRSISQAFELIQLTNL
jgi:hypothetical protein